MKTVNVLGTEYTIEYKDASVDTSLGYENDGYCDHSSYRIVIANKDSDADIDDFEKYQKSVVRHEIIHAFMNESGLRSSWEHKDGQDETIVDWIAIQFPKMLKAFKEVDAI